MNYELELQATIETPKDKVMAGEPPANPAALAVGKLLSSY
jgi:hypothetical protein